MEITLKDKDGTFSEIFDEENVFSLKAYIFNALAGKEIGKEHFKKDWVDMFSVRMYKNQYNLNEVEAFLLKEWDEVSLSNLSATEILGKCADIIKDLWEEGTSITVDGVDEVIKRDPIRSTLEQTSEEILCHSNLMRV